MGAIDIEQGQPHAHVPDDSVRLALDLLDPLRDLRFDLLELCWHRVVSRAGSVGRIGRVSDRQRNLWRRRGNGRRNQ